MKCGEIYKFLFVLFCFIVIPVQFIVAEPFGTAFTYQGRLIDANKPADGLYDFQFKIFDDVSGGNKLGADVNKAEVNVIDGYFTVELDFGSVFDGNERWLEIGVRQGDLNEPNVYTYLNPRQKILPAPYALYAKNAAEVSNNNGALPSGVIVMWSGSIANIPSGWALCNGTNGTPDLRDRFVVGAGSSYTVATTGGATTHLHAAGSLATTFIGSGMPRGAPPPPGAVTRYSVDDNSGGGDSDMYSLNNIAIAGNTVSASSLPPYYALAYIMKL